MMKKNCVFTICATNYVGLAMTLERSINRYCDNIDFYIVVADEPSIRCVKDLPNNVIVAKDSFDYDRDKWNEMAFKYNLTEFCTSIKPAAILYFFEKSYNKVVYLDPDILFFSSMKVVFDLLDRTSCVLTPHITIPDINVIDKGMMGTGVFNLGFVGFKKSGRVTALLEWWRKRLEDNSFDSLTENLYTDQKWADFFPAFLGEELYVSRNLGMNVAPWNFAQRRIENIDGKLYVTSRVSESEKHELVFVHYSGFKYEVLEKGEIIHKHFPGIADYADIKILFIAYQEALSDGLFKRFKDEPYSYSHFSDAEYVISPEIRRLYRGYIESRVEIEPTIPFAIESPLFKVYKKYHFTQKGNVIHNVHFDLSNASNKKKMVRMIKMMSLLVSIIGARNYIKIIKIFRRLSIIENHYGILLHDKDLYCMRNQ